MRIEIRQKVQLLDSVQFDLESLYVNFYVCRVGRSGIRGGEGRGWGPGAQVDDNMRSWSGIGRQRDIYLKS